MQATAAHIKWLAMLSMPIVLIQSLFLENAVCMSRGGPRRGLYYSGMALQMSICSPSYAHEASFIPICTSTGLPVS